MKIAKYLRRIPMVCVFFISLSLSACANGNTSMENKNEDVHTLTIPEVEESGGFELNTDTLYCIVATDGACKYSKFESKAGNHVVEFYANQTEIIIIDSSENGMQYYHETAEAMTEKYENPLIRVYDDLRKLDFKWMEDKGEMRGYQATKIEQTIEQQQIDYTEYKLQMTWLDEKEYIFSYYCYSDGATLISADAPDEINDRLVPDTKWRIDIENSCVRNEEDNRAVLFNIVSTMTGKALSPDNSGNTTIETISYVRVYVDKDSGLIQQLQYLDDENVTGTAVNILNKVEITKPEITENMSEMDEETMQMDMMLISVLESLI